MGLTNLQVFNQYAYTTFIEKINYNIALFNAATRGGLILRSQNNQGDYTEEAIYQRISGLVRRRDAYGSGAVSAVDLNQTLSRSVKVAAGTPPVNIDPHWWDWINRAPSEPGVIIGSQLAEETLADMVTVAIKATVAAITNADSVLGAGTLIYDGTAGNGSLNTLNSTAAKFGDRANQILCWLMHSKVLFDIFGAALTNANQLFTFGTVQVVQDGFGRPFVVTDQTDLTYTSSGTKYQTIGLSAGAVVIDRNNDYLENMETKNGFENLVRTWQAQWSYNLSLKGYAWDKNNGGASPTTAAIATGTNWDKYAASIKDTSGVIANTQ